MTPEAMLAWVGASDIRALTLTLYGEARGEPIEGRIAVGCVVRNRMRSKYRGRSVAEVCLWPAQFSCWTARGGVDNFAHLRDVTMALAAGEIPPWSEMEEGIYDETAWIANGILDGTVLDRVRGSTHYMTALAFRTNPPRWAIGVQPSCTVGAHVFFRVA